ncbi:MAG TPA: protein kinase [Planktothrix sp.]|jgi:serine/threonine protein kinase
MNSSKSNNENKLLQLAAPLLEAPESSTNLYNYSSKTNSTAAAQMYSRMDCYSMAQLPYLSLSYSPPEKYAPLLITNQSDQLYLAANILPSLLAIMVSMFPLETLSLHTLHGALYPPLLLVAGLAGSWYLAWRWQVARISANRSQKSRLFAKIPDRIALTSDGIQLGWSTPHRFFTSNCLRWSKLRLVYLEKDEGEDGYFICIRSSFGGLLRFHSAGFACKAEEEMFLSLLLEHAPQACKEPPRYLSVQPERTSSLNLRLRWLRFTCTGALRKLANSQKISQSKSLIATIANLIEPKTKNDQACKSVDEMAADLIKAQSSRLGAGSVLQDGRYKIIEIAHRSFDCITYLAEAVDPNRGNRVVSTFGENSAIETQIVQIEEYSLLPCSGFFLDCDDGFNRLSDQANQRARLDNKRIARWLDFFVTDGHGYIVSEKCSGTTVRNYVGKNGPLSEKRTVSLALQMADIVSYLHGSTVPITHGNLNPDSFVITDTGELKLVGSPRLFTSISKQVGGPSGRPAYMAPEQLRGSPCKQSDIYALGATLHFMLTGNDPQILQQMQAQPTDESVSETMNALIAGATEQKLPQRIANIELFKRQLIQSEAEHLITRLIS